MKQITQFFFKGESLTLNFPELFIREKYVKMDSKNSESTNIEQKRYFCLRPSFNFLQCFLHKNRFTQLIYDSYALKSYLFNFDCQNPHFLVEKCCLEFDYYLKCIINHIIYIKRVKYEVLLFFTNQVGTMFEQSYIQDFLNQLLWNFL